MALVLKDRVKETTTTTGTGSITLAGATTGYQSFSVIGNGNTCYYAIVGVSEWEVGLGTYTASGTSLSRDSVLESSNGGSLVNFSAGEKDVFVTYPAERALTTDAIGSTIQEYLVSGTNIKTVNGNTLLGSGNLAVGGSSTITIDNKTSAYTVVAGDLGKIINCTSGTFTVSLTAAATLGAGFNCWIWNTSSSSADAITIDPNGAETIDGATTRILRAGEGCQIICDGANWQTGDKKTMRAYAENNFSTLPTATGNQAIAIGGGTGVASTASATQSFAINGSAGSSRSSAIGWNSAGSRATTASGAGAMALGGSYASGTDSFAAGVANNSSTYGAQGANSIAIGYRAKPTGVYSQCFGAAIATANGSYAFCADGANGGATSSGQGAYAFGEGAIAGQVGKYAFSSARVIAVAGDAQYGNIVIKASTTGTAVVLTSNLGSAGTTNQLIVANNQVMAFTGTLIGKQTGSANIAAYKIEGTLVNNAGTVTMPTGTLTAIGTDSIGLTSAPTLSADNTNKGLTVTSGAKTATNIRWVATIQSTELTYA